MANPFELTNERRKQLVLLLVFAVSYAVLAFLPILTQSIQSPVTPLGGWAWTGVWQSDWMYWLMPLPAFFLTAMALRWYAKNYKSDFPKNPIMPVLILAFGLASYWLVMAVYYQNISQLNGGQPVPYDFWGSLRSSAYFVFVLASVLGWIGYKITEDWLKFE